MLRLAMTIVGSRAVAEEVLQETWIAVFRNVNRFEARASLKTWVYRILANTAKTRAARERRTIPLSALRDPARVPEPAVPAERFRGSEDPVWPGHWSAPPVPWDELPEKRLETLEVRRRLEEAIERLPAAQRAVISLRDIEGWTSEEVCNALV